MQGDDMRLFLVLFAFVGFVALAQSRDVRLEAADVRVTSVTLWPLADGGCDARACGELSADGGVTLRECETWTLRAAANVGRCQALAGVGQRRVQRAMNFTVDAGE
jgi:hypothetical protein